MLNLFNKLIISKVKFLILTKKKSTHIISIIIILFISSIILNQNSNVFKFKNISDKIHSQLANLGFKLKYIYIEGRYYVKKNDILQAVKVSEDHQILNINLSDIFQILNNNDWIETVKVKRILPNSLKIIIKEKKPIAIWQKKKGYVVITENGDIIPNANLSKFKFLPIVIGENANLNTLSIIKSLRQMPDLYKNIWSISFINNRRWDIHLNQGIKILLPERNI